VVVTLNDEVKSAFVVVGLVPNTGAAPAGSPVPPTALTPSVTVHTPLLPFTLTLTVP
jgi:hypothetical protein